MKKTEAFIFAAALKIAGYHEYKNELGHKAAAASFQRMITGEPDARGNTCKYFIEMHLYRFDKFKFKVPDELLGRADFTAEVVFRKDGRRYKIDVEVLDGDTVESVETEIERLFVAGEFEYDSLNYTP